MTTLGERSRMAASILNFEARRDANGNLAIYTLPSGDGGGKYEVAGINERYNKATADVLVGLINAKRYTDAEALATEFIAQETDRASTWTKIAAIEFYLRDCVLNRGASGAAKILQDALGTHVDGVVGKVTLAAIAAAESNAANLLQKLRNARESYERNVVGRGPGSKFWKGLVNRWDNALSTARTFSMSSIALPLAAPPVIAEATSIPTGSGVAVMPALRIGNSGPTVKAWQTFLVGQGFQTGVVDGYFGEATRDATSQFQSRSGLSVDGVAGRQTLLKAATGGFELIEEPAEDNTSSNFPPPPSFPNLSSNQRAEIFGMFNYVAAPTADNPEAIKILGSWVNDHITTVPLPQLRKALGARVPAGIPFHKLAATQLQAMWAEWDASGLLGRVLTFEGSFVPRFIRGSRTSLSNHSFGTAFDINYRWNKLGERPALVGDQGSVRELVKIANKHGFYWGGHFQNRRDGMHFEVAFLSD